MNQLRLSKLSLHNFKGIRDFTLDANGGDIAVRGDNATGKTTLADSFAWLLFGKDSAGKADFDIKTLDSEGEAIHGLDHEVEATLTNGTDEKAVTLRKVFREKWTKRRGQAEREFTGNTTDHFIDGVPVKQKEYQEAVADIADEAVFRLLTDPAHFAERLHWEKRREILLDVCGDVTDSEVIASTESLANLPEILEGRSLEDHRKVIAARRREINAELDKIPVRIDEAERALPDVSEFPSEDEIETGLENTKTTKAEAEQELARIEAGGQIAEKTKELREVEAAIQEAETAFQGNVESQKKALREARDMIANDLSQAQDKVREAERKIANAKTDIELLTQIMDERREEWQKTNDLAFEHDEPDTCAACGQSLPEEKVEAAREKALEIFNSAKSRNLTKLSEEGKRAKEDRDKLETGEEARRLVLSEAKAKMGELENALKEADEQIKSVIVPEPDISALEEKGASLNEVIGELRIGNAEMVEEVRDRITALDSQIQEAQEALDAYKAVARGEERIAELKAQEEKLAAEFEELERQLYLTEEFVRTKVQMLEERINNRFALARFRLFKVLVNGGLEECCDVNYEGVPWGSLNTGAQINIGLDIINTLTDHYDVTPPVFVDHAESVTAIIPTRGQAIKLVVSEKDKELRVEAVQEKAAATAQ